MKTTKKILTWTIIASSILALWASSALAYQWNWQWWQWKWMWNWQGQYMNSGEKWNMDSSHNPWEMLENIALQDLSDDEREMLYYGYSEELLARDMYNYFYELYWVETFKNIADSETKHMEAVKVLLDRYELDSPSDYGELVDEFDALKTEWEKWLKEALEVGLKIEILDIEDISETIKSTDNDDFKIIFTRIWGASYNHMRWFLKALTNNSLETDIDYSDYLSSEDLASKWSISYKLSQKLENDWVYLPEMASSSYMKENCDDSWNHSDMWKWQWKNMNNSWNMMNNWKNQIQVNSSLKNKYSSTIKTKYQSKVNALSEDKLNSLVAKIDELAMQINDSTKYSSSVKENYIAVLAALKDIVLEKLSEQELDLDSLFY